MGTSSNGEAKKYTREKGEEKNDAFRFTKDVLSK